MKKVSNVNRKSYRCDKDMSLKSFTSCAFDYLKLKTASNNCTGMITEVNKTASDTNICKQYKTYTKFRKEEEDILENLLINGTDENCLKPCKKIEYSAKLTMVHENRNILTTQKTPSDGVTFSLLFAYEDFNVQENQEFMIIDGGALLSSVGGFLGLFLGFSTLSVAEWIQVKLKT